MKATCRTSPSPTARALPTRRVRCCTRIPASRGTSPPWPRRARRKKKPRGGELTAAEKRINRKLGRIRVRVEHALAGVKRCRIVKDVLLNAAEDVSDSDMEVACGLHNLRFETRQRR